VSYAVSIIYNPMAGRFKADMLANLVTAFEDADCEVSTTTTEINRPIDFQSRCNLLCVLGGDGALRLVLQSMLQQNISTPVCVFPGGTINLASRELNYPKKPKPFAAYIVKRIKNGLVQKMPILMSDNGPIVCSFSAGPDATAVQNVSERLKRKIGRFAYVVAVLKLLSSWPNYRIKTVATLSNGQTKELSGGAIFLAKGLYYAGPFSFAPYASIINSNFHLLHFPKFGRLKFIRMMWLLAIKGHADKISGVSQIEAVDLRIDVNSDAPCQIDGDMVELPCHHIWMSDKSIPIVR